MRSDMAKIIVERPRVPAHSARKRRAIEDFEALPSFMGMRKAAKLSGDFKMLNENLAPLRRYLIAQAGRPWRKVYSDICQHLKPDSTVQQHVRDHIADFVAHPVVVHAGVRCGQSDWGGLRPLSDGYWPLFVDPDSGLLRKLSALSYGAVRRREMKKQEAERHQRMRVIDANHQLHLLEDGNWWKVTLAEVPLRQVRKQGGGKRVYDEQEELPVVDVVLDAKLSRLERGKLYERNGVFAIDKRPLSKKELKINKLR